MPSAGTPRTTVRIATELMERVQAQIDSLLVHSPRGDWTVGEFIRVAIEEKLAKMSRSRGSRGSPKELVQQHQVPEFQSANIQSSLFSQEQTL